MPNVKGMNDAEAYHKLYGDLVYSIPFYCARFDFTSIAGTNFKSLAVVR
jgi:hypothetical protein